MGIPLHCSNCGELVGIDTYPFAGFHPESSRADIFCPGKGKHSPPVETSERKLFGLVEHVTIKYPETFTKCSWNRYVGAKHWFLVWLAIILTGDGVVINKKWCWWEWNTGFFGDGKEEFQSV